MMTPLPISVLVTLLVAVLIVASITRRRWR